MIGDESYASASSWFKLEDTLRSIFNYKHFLPAHQGRGAEKVLFMAMIKEGQTVPNNMHFSPDRVTASGGLIANLIIEEGKKLQSNHPFKGDVEVDQLTALIEEKGRDSIPFIMVTVTRNNAGGQPVSMQNILDIRAVADRY